MQRKSSCWNCKIQSAGSKALPAVYMPRCREGWRPAPASGLRPLRLASLDTSPCRGGGSSAGTAMGWPPSLAQRAGLSRRDDHWSPSLAQRAGLSRRDDHWSSVCPICGGIRGRAMLVPTERAGFSCRGDPCGRPRKQQPGESPRLLRVSYALVSVFRPARPYCMLLSRELS